MDHHPTPAELEGLVLGRLSARRTQGVIAHLLRGCEECRSVLSPYLVLLKGHTEALPLPKEEDYDGALDRALAAVGRLGVLPSAKADERRTTQELLDRLVAGGLEALAASEDWPEDRQALSLYEALLERSWALRHDDPDQMVQLALLASRLADRLDPGELGSREVANLQCRAWIELGNAYRVADELDDAESALGRAAELYLQGTGDELLCARLYTVFGSLYSARRLFELAATCLDLVIEVYQRHGDEHLAGRALIMKGIFAGYQGNAEEALQLIQQGLSSVDERRDPGLVFSAIQARASFLVDCGRFREAQRELGQLRRRKTAFGGRLNELKVRWLEGQIAEGLGELDRAEKTLAAVKLGFQNAGLSYKAALVGLELGVVWYRQHRLADTERAIRESAEAFLALRIERELVASVLLLRKATEMRHLTLVLLRETVEVLRQAEPDPAARFQAIGEA